MSNIDYRPDLDDNGESLTPPDKDRDPYFYISPEMLARLGQRAMQQINSEEEDRTHPAC